jgi:uncharacterized membrane protein
MKMDFLKTALVCAGLVFAGLSWAEPSVPPPEDLQSVSGTDDHEIHRGEKIARWLEDKGVSRPMAIAAISTLPIVELRGAVPVGHILYETRQLDTPAKIKQSVLIYLVAVVGNMLPVPFILLLLGPVSNVLMRFKAGKSMIDWLFERTRRKSANIEKYEELGLTVFVAIPLPVTGAWTGAMAAFLMGLPFWKSMLFTLLGVMIAGVIMTILSLMGWMGAFIAGAVLLALVASAVLKSLNNKGARI